MSEDIKINEYFEYRDSPQEMWFEASFDNKPTELYLRNHAKTKGFTLENIDIWFDNMQGFWRVTADLIN